MIATFMGMNPVFWPYCAAISLLLLGAPAMFQGGWRQARGLEKALLFGPLFLAVPMGAFGAFHFILPEVVAPMIPSWVPVHMFWVYLVGLSLIAAGLSIVTNRHSALAAALLGLMLLSFVLMLHIPALVSDPSDRFALAIVFRDLSFSVGAFALAAGQTWRLPDSMSRNLSAVLRTLVAVAAVIFAVEHFLHPQFVPVIPLRQPLPAWFPAHAPLAYFTGSVLVVTGLCMVFNWWSRLAATWLGIVVFVIVALVYLPLLIAKPLDLLQFNYVMDTLAYSGSILLVAGILPHDPSPANVDHPRRTVMN